MEDFDPNITDIEELRRLVPDIVLQRKAPAIVLTKGEVENEPAPLAKATAPGIGHNGGPPLDEPPLAKAPEPIGKKGDLDEFLNIFG